MVMQPPEVYFCTQKKQTQETQRRDRSSSSDSSSPSSGTPANKRQKIDSSVDQCCEEFGAK